ncbi:hypothetical protein A6R68_01031, partial [Neotoma lepida]
AKREERGQQASARKLTSDHRSQFSQAPQPGTPFPFPQKDDDTPPEWGKHLTSTKDRWDLPLRGMIPLTWHKFRCQKPYEGKTFKVPDSWTTDSLQSLRALIKITSSQKTLDPIKEPKENKEGKVPLSREVPECRSNPLSKKSRPSICLTACDQKKSGLFGAHTCEGAKKPDYVYCVGRTYGLQPIRHQSNCDVFGTLEKFKEDDTVPGPSSAYSSTDQHGLGPYNVPHLPMEFWDLPLLPKMLRDYPYPNKRSSEEPNGILELNTSAQGSQEPSPSTQVSGQASLHAKATLGQPRHSPYPKISPRLSNSTKHALRHVLFPEGDVRYSLSELDGLRSIPSAKGRLTSSMYAQKDSSPTSNPQRSVPLTVPSELSFRSSSPLKEISDILPLHKVSLDILN